MTGNDGNDQLSGLAGNDLLHGGLGTDTLDGGDGNDQLYGDQGNDSLTGGNGNDLLDGGTGIDALDGRAGADRPEGGTGNVLANTLTGNNGANRLDGGAGADMFVFSTALGAGNVDSVADFVLDSDHLQLAASVFGGLGPTNQALGASLFASGAGTVAAADAATRIVFDTSTGNLYYDMDGAGGAAAQWFATLHGNGLNAIAADSFFVLP